MNTDSETLQRQAWMATLAKSSADMLLEVWQEAGLKPVFEWLRTPEIGAVMVRGAMGGTGAAFNLGEMTVTRCSLRLQDGVVGHAYVAGRDRKKAEISALCDALMQTDQAVVVREKILEPLKDATLAARTGTAQKAAATKVDFFTLVRGED